ncbi:MAG TPA: RNA polymerase sigma factor [Acidimicrobiales bacterium]|nr:RNA polymerase sigma factor [Acidimicrobiales bacterium]
MSAAPALLTRVAAGDDDAVTQLMRTFSPLIHDIARRHRSTGSSGDDLVQETMVRLWRSADRFDAARGNETGFVAAVARNAAIDLSRRRATRTSNPVANPDAVLPPVAFPSDRVATTVTVRAALAKLPPAQHELLRLAYFEHLTQPEIARRLGIPVGTVKSRTFQALRALRSILHEG